MKHKHHAMIVAKAENMELVVFAENINTGEWWECSLDFPFNSQQRFFLCLPQHKEACLHWLNGGDVQIMSMKWEKVLSINLYPWEGEHDFMDDSSEFRIKPKKEKRWIVYRNGAVYGEYLSPEDINNDFKSTGQVIEIEVEV